MPPLEPAVYDPSGVIVPPLPDQTTDPSEAARALYRDCHGDLLGVLQRARNGRALASKGRADEVAWCAQRSLWPVIGVLRGGWVVPLTVGTPDRA